MIIRKSYNFFQRLLSLKAYGLRYSRDIHLEPKMPFCDNVSQVGCPNGSLSFPLGFSIWPTDIQIEWVGVQMNVKAQKKQPERLLFCASEGTRTHTHKGTRS